MRESEEKTLKDIKKLVLDILKENPETRDSDKRLYIEVCRHKCPTLLSQTLESAFLYGKLPNYESVRRSRQDIQARHVELRPSKTVQQFREDQERQYMMEFCR